MATENKKEKIIEGAQAVFARYGYKKTSMQDIAREVGISRPSLYLEFENKEDIFRSVSRSVQQRANAVARQQLKVSGPVAERIVAMVLKREEVIYALVSASPHGADLFDANSRLAADITESAQSDYRSIMAGALQCVAAESSGSATSAATDMQEPARMLIAALHGQKSPGLSMQAYIERLQRMTKIFIRGLLATLQADSVS